MANTPFRKTVKKRLIDLEQTQEWLCQQVTEKTGLFCDQPYLSRILSGERTPDKIISAVCEILDIPNVAESQTEKQD